MKKSFSLFVLTLLLSLAAWSNDGTFFSAGNHFVPLQETDIAVRKEILTISLGDNGYASVDVYYEFWNPTQKTKRVLMGFEALPPMHELNFYSSGRHPYIYDFTVAMNGNMLDCRTAACHTMPTSEAFDRVDTTRKYEIFESVLIPAGTDEPNDTTPYWEYTYVYYFDAEFQPGLNYVHHTYRCRLSVINSAPWYFNYMLTPAARWANRQIDDFTLVIRADQTAKHFIIASNTFPSTQYRVTKGMGKMRENQTKEFWMGDYCEFSLRNGVVELHLENFQPKEELLIMAKGLYWEVHSSVGDFYDRSSTMCLDYALYRDTADTVFLNRVIRNLPYAHRGHVFKNKRLKEYFENLWWYLPDPEYKDTDEDFTPADRTYANWGKMAE